MFVCHPVHPVHPVHPARPARPFDPSIRCLLFSKHPSTKHQPNESDVDIRFTSCHSCFLSPIPLICSNFGNLNIDRLCSLSSRLSYLGPPAATTLLTLSLASFFLFDSYIPFVSDLFPSAIQFFSFIQALFKLRP